MTKPSSTLLWALSFFSKKCFEFLEDQCKSHGFNKFNKFLFPITFCIRVIIITACAYPLTTISNEETFLKDFLDILKRISSKCELRYSVSSKHQLQMSAESKKFTFCRRSNYYENVHTIGL